MLINRPEPQVPGVLLRVWRAGGEATPPSTGWLPRAKQGQPGPRSPSPWAEPARPPRVGSRLGMHFLRPSLLIHVTSDLTSHQGRRGRDPRDRGWGPSSPLTAPGRHSRRRGGQWGVVAMSSLSKGRDVPRGCPHSHGVGAGRPQDPFFLEEAPLSYPGRRPQRGQQPCERRPRWQHFARGGRTWPRTCRNLSWAAASRPFSPPGRQGPGARG